MAIRILSGENITGNVHLTDEKILAFRSTNDYSIQYRDLDFRFIGSADGTTNRYFSFGHYTSDNPAGTWNGKVYINSYTGAVGIGANSPGRKLTVTDNVSGDANNLLLSNENDTNGDSASIGFSMLSNNTYVKSGIFFERTTTQGRGSLHLAVNNEVNGNNVTKSDAKLTINNTGNIGIGTNDPDAKVHIFKSSNGATTVGTASDELILENDTDCGLTIRSAADATGVVSFASPTDHNVGQLYYNHDDDSMVIRTNDAIRTIIGSSGIMYIMGATASTNNSLQLQYNSTAGTAEIYSKSTGGNTTFEFYTSNSGTTTQKFNIGSSGDVKITTNGKFLQGIRNTGGSVIDMIGFGAGTDRLQIKGGTSGGAESIAFFDTAGQMATFYNSNFGIGVTSPSGKLEVAGGNTLGFRLSNLGNQSAYDQIRMTYTGYNSGAPTVTFMPLTTPGSGNAYTTFHFSNTNGINPSSNNNANVDIDGNLTIGNAKGLQETVLTLRNYDANLAQTNTIQASLRMSGRYWSGATSQLVETRINSVHQESNGNGGSALTFMTQTGGSGVVEQMRIDKEGNVGIKTTPSAVLHIYNPYDVTADPSKCGIRMTRVAGGSQSWLWSLGQSGVSNNYFGLRDITHGVYKMMFKEGTGTQVMFGNPSNNGTFGASNTILSIKGSTSGGEGILQITGLGNNATDNVGRIDFHSYNEADAMCSIRSVRGSADDIGDLEFYNNDGGSGEITLKLDHDHKALFGKVPGDGNGPHLIVNPYSYTTLMQGTSTANIFVIRNGTGLSANVGMIIFESNAGGASGQITTNSSSNTTSYNTSGSDERLKKNITDWDENVLDKFKDIQPKEFHFKTQKDSDGKLKGYIAQNEVDKFPEAYPLVEDKESGEKRYLFNPSGMNVYLMKAIQELKVEIELLKNK